MPLLATDISRWSFQQHLRAQSVANREMRAALQDASRRTSAFVEDRLSGVDGASAAVRRAQMEMAQAALAAEQARLYQGPIKRSVKQGIDASIQAGHEAQSRIIEMLAKNMSRADAEVLARSMAAAARQRLDDMAARMAYSYPISTQVAKTQALSTKMLDRVLNAGIASGKSAKEIASDVRRFIRPDTPGGSSYAAMRMARTELNNAFHISSIRAASEVPWSTGMKWTLSGSHGKPDECDDYAQHGIYKLSEVPAKPHPQCLCYTITVTESFDTFAGKLLAGEYEGW